MKNLCWSYTKVKLFSCKTRGHVRTFQRYFDLLTQKASRPLFITTITVNQWILDAVWRVSIQGWENIGSQAIMLKKMIFCIHKMKVEKLFVCIGQSTSDEKWDKINDWIDILLPKMSRHYVGARHVFFTNEQQKIAGSRKNWDAWSYMIIKSYEQTFDAAIHAQSCKGACHTLDFLDFILIPKNMIVLISLNWCSIVWVGLGQLRKGENELSMKKEYF